MYKKLVIFTNMCTVALVLVGFQLNVSIFKQGTFILPKQTEAEVEYKLPCPMMLRTEVIVVSQAHLKLLSLAR